MNIQDTEFVTEKVKDYFNPNILRAETLFSDGFNGSIDGKQALIAINALVERLDNYYFEFDYSQSEFWEIDARYMGFYVDFVRKLRNTLECICGDVNKPLLAQECRRLKRRADMSGWTKDDVITMLKDV